MEFRIKFRFSLTALLTKPFIIKMSHLQVSNLQFEYVVSTWDDCETKVKWDMARDGALSRLAFCHPKWQHAIKFFSYFLNRSECDLKRSTCGEKVVPVPLHHCPTTALCNQQCDERREFVCGSDNKFYKSPCEMKRENCG